MIRKMVKNELEKVAKYTYKLNSVPEYKCKAFPTDYAGIVNQFSNILNHPDDELLICTDGNNLNGVLALCVEPEEKYLEAVGGVFAHKDYQSVAREFYEYLKRNYGGYQFDAAYPEENKHAIDFMKSIGAKVLAFEYELRLHKNNFKEQLQAAYITEIDEKHYNSFTKIHNRLNPDVYWTGERLLNTLNKFDIFIAAENNEVAGAVVTSHFSKKVEEIYFIEVEEASRNHGYVTALLNKALKHAFENGTDELIVMTDKENTAAMHFLCHLFYCFCRENGDSYDLLTDLDLLTALGLPSYSDYEDVIKKFKELIKTYHPDNGGDAEKFLEIMKKYKNFKWCQSKQ